MTRQLALFVIVAVGCAITTSGCIYQRLFLYNFPDMHAPELFDSRRIEPSPTPRPLPRGDRDLTVGMSPAEVVKWGSFDALLEENDTFAFLAVHHGKIVFERYFHGLSATTPLPAFSMSKTYAALLVGCALEDGLFGSVEDKLPVYIPELADRAGYRDMKLDHMLRLISGIDFKDESAAGAMFYYSLDLRSRIYAYGVAHPPGTHYAYGSVNIQIVWDALQRRLGSKTVSQYFQEKIWDPIGAVDPAMWALDSREKGAEKFFGGFSATARDHARLGLLFLHDGRAVDGKRIVDPSWIRRSLELDTVVGKTKTTDGVVERGKYQWYLTADRRGYWAKGFQGQYVFVVPSKDVVLVRFANGYGQIDWPALMLRIADML